jgi:Domain of unknown function (DUF5658)
MRKEQKNMNSTKGRKVLGSFFGILIVVFMFQGGLLAGGTEDLAKTETGLPVAEFSLVAAGASAAAGSATTAAPLVLTAPDPAPQFNPRFTPPVIGGGASFGDAAFKVSMATIFALNLGDYFLTKACLKHAGTAEGNPMMTGIVKNPYVFAAVKIGGSALSVILLDKIYKKSKILGWIMSTAINSAMSYVVLHNYSVLRQVQAAPGLN